MSAYEELVRTGVAGPGTLQMLLEVTLQTVRARNYPDPGRTGAWSDDDVAELAHEVVVACSGGRSLVDTLLTAATDENSLRAVVSHRVRLAFADRSRKTDTGHLSRRVQKLLSEGPDLFTQVGQGSWALVSPEQGEAAGPPTFEDLLRAAFAVPDVWLTRWSVSAQRRSPFASKQDLQRLVTAVLVRVGGPLSERVLVKVLADYFGLQPGQVSIDEQGSALDPAATTDVATSVENEILVDAIWIQLTEYQRTVLPWLEDSLSSTADALAWSKTRTHNIRTAARTVIVRALALTPDGRSERMSAAEAAGVVQQLQERAVREREQGVTT